MTETQGVIIIINDLIAGWGCWSKSRVGRQRLKAAAARRGGAAWDPGPDSTLTVGFRGRKLCFLINPGLFQLTFSIVLLNASDISSASYISEITIFFRKQAYKLKQLESTRGVRHKCRTEQESGRKWRKSSVNAVFPVNDSRLYHPPAMWPKPQFLLLWPQLFL